MSVKQQVVKPHRAKKGKKCRKYGRGLRKVQKSRFDSYAAMFAVCAERKLQRMASRKIRLARRAAKKLAASE